MLVARVGPRATFIPAVFAEPLDALGGSGNQFTLESLAWWPPRGLRALSSPSRNQICVPCSESVSPNHWAAGKFPVPAFEVRKPRHRKVPQVAEGHTAHKW